MEKRSKATPAFYGTKQGRVCQAGSLEVTAIHGTSRCGSTQSFGVKPCSIGEFVCISHSFHQIPRRQLSMALKMPKKVLRTKIEELVSDLVK
ncbi:hypothetical protein HispidOSU_000506 [Sigmodon hispidus]